MIRKISLLLLLLFIGSLQLKAQEGTAEKNYIYWSDSYRLEWTDFDRLPERYSDHSAYSVVGYESSIQLTDELYKATIRTYFDKDESWAKSWVAILLVHEQGHFDLAELHARKFRQKVHEAMKDESITLAKFEYLNDETLRSLEDAHADYDRATNFSMDYRAQLDWAETIQKQLQALDSYADPTVRVQRVQK